MKKFLITMLSVLLFGCTVNAAEGVINTSASIGGSTANMTYIDMSPASRTGEAVISDQLSPASAKTLINKVTDGKVVAAMNGGFFNAYYKTSGVSFPDNYPRVYGTVISGGKILNGGDIAGAPALVFDSNGTPQIGYAEVMAYLDINGSRRRIGDGVNNINSHCFTEDMTATFYAKKGEIVNYIKNGVVTGSVVSEGVNIKTAEGLMIVLGDYNMKQGDSVSIVYDAKLDNVAVDGQTIITCGPMLLNDGKNVATSGSSYDSKQDANSVAQRSFAAIAPDGRLILGEVSSSPNKIADYLLSIGVKDAMLFDGGASSMLYNDSKGFVQSAGRNLASIFTIVDKYKTDNQNLVQPSNVSVNTTSGSISVPAYNIGGNNYFKLRDMAYMLKDGSHSITVDWNSELNTITVANGSSSGLQAPDTNAVQAKAVESSAALTVNGNAVTLTAYNINGNNYFKLRDIMQYLGVEVAWDGSYITLND